MSEIIDMHTHIGVDIGGGYSQSPEQLLSKMEKAGVEKAGICGFPTPGEDVRDSNKRIAKVKSRRLIGFATINPRDEDATAEVERCIGKLGLNGLMVDVEASNLFMTTWFPLAEIPVISSFFRAAERARVPLLIHMRNPFAVWNASGLAHFIDRMAKRHRRLPLITNTLIPGISLALGNKNVYLETEYSGQPIDIERYVTMSSARRILFASNAPVEHPYVMRKMVEKSRLGKKEQVLILAENARGLISL